MNQPLLDFLNQQFPSALELLRQMVAVNSFTANREGVNQLGRLTADAFQPLGFSADRVPSIRSEFGDHVVLTRPGRSSKRIGLISHLDTVYPAEEEARNHFVWQPAGDRVYGPGTVDIKGGTVMIHLVLQALRKFAPDVFEEFTWVVLLNSSEEVLSHDFGKLCLERLQENGVAALVFEAGACSDRTFVLVTARKGRSVFHVKVQGRGAHAGSHHERGANAIVQMAGTLQRIAALTDYARALTFNVGWVTGGTVVNRVPHQADAEVEMRAFSPDVFRDGTAAMLALNGPGAVCSADGRHPCEVSIQGTQESPPWPRNAETDKLLALWQAAAHELGLSVVREERGGISDGNFICHAIPTVDGLGPHGDNAHCSERSADGSKEPEYVDIGSFVTKAALNVTAILKLARGGALQGG